MDYTRLPKVELHLHLDCSLSYKVVQKLDPNITYEAYKSSFVGPVKCYDLADFATKPLTIIYPNAKGLAPSVLAQDGSVGIRITTDPICLKLIRAMRKPLVSTSANITGQPSPTEFMDIDTKITHGVDAIVEDRLTEKRTKASQIIKIGLGGQVKIIRK